MAVLKQIKFGTDNATPIAQTIVTAASDSVLSVVGTNTELDKDANPSYAVDLKIDNATLVKSTDSNKVLKVGTVPAAQVSVATGTGLTATDAQTAFKELKDSINAVGGAAKSYTIVKETKGLSANVKEQYKLQEIVGEKRDFVGAPIDIYKDSSLKEVKLENQQLVFTYILENGTESVVNVDVSTFLAESEFADGLQVTNHTVSVKIDETSEGFLTVSEAGVKLAGVQDAIDAKVAALDVDDAAATGQYVSSVSETDGKIAVSRLNVSDAVLNGYAKGEKPASTVIAATDDVKSAIAKLEHQVDAAKAAATTKVTEGTDDGNNMTITSATSKTDGSTTYTINLTDVASKAALDKEIAARKAVDGQSGDTYAANVGTNYISGAISLNDADVKLDAALKAEETRAKSAEDEIASKVGLSGAEGSRTWTPTTNYGGSTTSVKDNMQALDTQLKEVTDKLAAVQYQVNGTTLEFFGISPKTV